MNIRNRQRAGSKIKESEFQSQVIGVARHLGWECYHVPDSRWVKSRGFPDLILMHDARSPYIIAMELKVGSRKPEPEQSRWIDGFRLAGVCAGVSYPDDMEQIIDLLAGKKGRDWYA